MTGEEADGLAWAKQRISYSNAIKACWWLHFLPQSAVRTGKKAILKSSTNLLSSENVMGLRVTFFSRSKKTHGTHVQIFARQRHALKSRLCFQTQLFPVPQLYVRVFDYDINFFDIIYAERFTYFRV